MKQYHQCTVYKYSKLLNTRYGYIKQHGTQKVDLIKFVMDEIINMAFQ